MPDNRTTPTIMLVDDDEMVLDSIKAFFSIESDYNLLTYTSAAARRLARPPVPGQREVLGRSHRSGRIFDQNG